MSQEIITLRLLGQAHQIKCDASEVETLEAAAMLLNEKVKKEQQKNLLSLEQATLLTALNLCGEQIAQQQNTLSEEQKNALSELNQRVILATEQ